MYETGKRLKDRLKNARTKLNMCAYDLGAIRIGLKAMLHRTRIKQHAWFANAKPLLIRLDDIDATFAQRVEVAGSVRIMITRYPAKLAAEKHLRREREVPEDYLKRVHFESAYNPPSTVAIERMRRAAIRIRLIV